MNGTNTVIKPRKTWSTRRIVVTAMLAAITMILAFTPIGLITMPAPLPSITLMHLPVIIAVLLEGPMVGVSIGFVFGLSSLIKAWGSGIVGLDLFFRNPLISVLPRMIIPLAVWAVYTLLMKLFTRKEVGDKVSSIVASVIGSLTNTVLCLGLIALIYGTDLTEYVNNLISTGKAVQSYLDHAGTWLVAIVGVPYGIAEAITAAIVCPIVTIAVETATKRYGRGRKPRPLPPDPKTES
jgi:uncharacterized membrane protein